jgi:hypothetical protein
MRSDKPESLDVQTRLLLFLRENESILCIVLSHLSFLLMDYESVSCVSRVVHDVSKVSWFSL